jgi:hypothetical protein
LFPNPAAEKIEIKSNQVFSQYYIRDIAGKIILSGQINEPAINVVSLPKGIYHLQIFDAKSQSASKVFVKE